MIWTCMAHQRPRPSRSKSGFTLVELVLVVVILSTFAIVAIGSYSNTLHWRRVSNQATSMLATLRNAHAMAVSQSKRVRVQIDATTYSVVIEDDPLDAPDVWTAPAGAWGEQFAMEEDVTVALRNIDDSTVAPTYVTFFPDGRAEPVEITVSHEKFADVIRLTVNKVTGQVKLEEVSSE